MHAGRSFDDVLDATLGLDRSAPAFTPGIATSGLFPAPVGLWPGVSAFRTIRATGLPHPLRVGPEPRRFRPRTPIERDAFTRLQGLGALLPPAITLHELKHAFRRLARQFHPDRHPGVTERDRARLGAQFAEVREAYDVLRSMTA